MNCHDLIRTTRMIHKNFKMPGMDGRKQKCDISSWTEGVIITVVYHYIQWPSDVFNLLTNLHIWLRFLIFK